MDDPLALVIDPDAGARSRVQAALTSVGIEVVSATTLAEAEALLRERSFSIVFVQAAVAGSGAGTVATIARNRPDAVIVTLGLAVSDPRARAALEAGAFDVIRDVEDANALAFAATRARRQAAMQADLARLRSGIQEREGYQQLVGRSDSVIRLRERMERSSVDTVPVLFRGEPGTGRELAARRMHAMSPRADAPFLVLHCSTYPPDRLAVELFGSPDSSVVPGAIEIAAGGTLYLDEIAALTLEHQGRLLECIRKDGVLEHDVRLVAGTAQDLEALAREKRFRSALLARLSTSVIVVDPLRDRLEDVPVLARFFLQTICEINALEPMRLSAGALDLMNGYAWPGNVRELRNAMEQAAILATSGEIGPAELPDRIRRGPRAAGAADGEPTPVNFRDAKRDVVDRFEQRYLQELLRRSGGNVTLAAQESGMLRSALQRLLRKHGLRSADFRAPRKGASTSPHADE